MSYRLEDQQIVGGSLAEVFAFFKDPRNLESLTPAFLGFRVVESTDPVVRLNTQIRYQLRLHGIPLGWTSRITEYVEGELFADEMLSGPYRRWYHRHLFRAVPGGVEIRDIVEYELPFGILGRLAHTLFVRRQLQAIFAYRTQVIATRFPGPSVLPDHEAVPQ